MLAYVQMTNAFVLLHEKMDTPEYEEEWTMFICVR